jgi:hypothetical protein
MAALLAAAVLLVALIHHVVSYMGAATCQQQHVGMRQVWLYTYIAHVAYACRVLQVGQLQLVTEALKRRPLQRHPGKLQATSGSVGLAAVVACAVAVLEMQQLAGDARSLVASIWVAPNQRILPADAGVLWEVHAWLVQHQLLDGQGLAGLLSEQQLAEGRAAAEASVYKSSSSNSNSSSRPPHRLLPSWSVLHVPLIQSCSTDAAWAPSSSSCYVGAMLI